MYELKIRRWREKIPRPRPPLLTPYDVDAYDAHSTPTPSMDWINHESQTHVLEETDWIEVDLLSEGGARDSSSLARAPAPQSDFVRGSFSQVPFTPGGEGWDAAARESMVKRAELAERAGAAWLEEFKAGVYLSSSALPNTLQGMQDMFDVDTGIKNVEVELERLTVVEDEELPQSYDDLFIDALRSAVRPVDSSSEEEEEEEDEEEHASGDDRMVDEIQVEGEAEVEALLNDTRPIALGQSRRKMRRKTGETWAVMDRVNSNQHKKNMGKIFQI